MTQRITATALAVFLVACGEQKVKPRVEDPETTPTQVAVDLKSIESKNGSKSYRLSTPLMERYELAAEPFAEFRKGIKVETFNDTTRAVANTLVADYARLDEKKEVWEVRGNVVGRNLAEDKALFTEQLFWDQKQDKIYTDKYVRVVDGRNQYHGTGFESDGAFKRWTFRNTRGVMEVSPAADSTAVDSTQQVQP